MKLSKRNIITALVSGAGVLGLSFGAAQSSHADANNISGTSNAHVDVKTGFLTLQGVPDLNFGEAANSTTSQNLLPLVNNNTGVNGDRIFVTDGRQLPPAKQGDPADQNGQGWNLTASLGDFVDQNKKPAANNAGFVIDLNQTTGINSMDKEGQPPLHMPTVSRTSIVAGAPDGTPGQTGATVVNAKPGTGYGTTQVFYNEEKNADLSMPANVPTGDYNAPITWTLSGTPAS